MLAIRKVDEPYFVQILKYELIKLNIVDVDADHFLTFINKFLSNYNDLDTKLFLLINKQYSLESLKKRFIQTNSKVNIRITFTLKKIISDIELYEISFKQI